MKIIMKINLFPLFFSLILLSSCQRVEKLYYPDGSLAAEYSIRKGLKSMVQHIDMIKGINLPK